MPGKRKRGSSHREERIVPESVASPKSFVVKHGHVGTSISQLVRDVRRIMEPNTASRLKERSSNKLKDYLVMAPSLKVSHLLAFSLTDVAPSLRIARLPQGPTFSFRIERYSLIKDIIATTRRPRSSPQAYISPPLLVLSSFPTGDKAPPHLALVLKCFQSLFPPLTPHTISLSSARRVVLVSWNPETSTIDVRHYLITVRSYHVSKRVRRILDGALKGSMTKVPKLGKEKDIADYVLKQAGEDGYETASTSAASDVDPEEYAVKLATDYVGRNNKKGDKRAVKLDEIGPRMELKLVKIVEGPPGKEGSVLYHEFVKRTAKETAAQKKDWAERERLRKQRREEQEQNIARKKETQEEWRGADEEDEDESEEDDQHEESEDDEGKWDDEVAMSEGEDDVGSEDDGQDSASDADGGEKAPQPPPRKRVRSDKPKGSIRLRG